MTRKETRRGRFRLGGVTPENIYRPSKTDCLSGSTMSFGPQLRDL